VGVRNRYRALYRMGVLPWDRPEPPRPLRALVEGPGARSPGVAVDLGCGTGASARYLAGLGWRVTAIDFIAKAIGTARRLDVEGRVTWRTGDVTVPAEVDPAGTLAGACDLVLDNGCLHGIPAGSRRGWAATVDRLAAPAATVLVRAMPPRKSYLGPAGIAAADVTALLDPAWTAVVIDEPHWLRYDLRQGAAIL